MGYFRGEAVIMKFQKRSARLRWWLSFPKYTRINSFAMVPGTDQVLTCGHYWSNEATSDTNTDTSFYNTQAVITRVQSDGTPELFMNINGANPVTTAMGKDECWGIIP